MKKQIFIGCAAIVLAFSQTPANGRTYQAPAKAQIDAIARQLPDSPYSPAPSIADREFWGKLANPELIEKAEEIAKAPIALVTDELYLEYSKEGTRKHFTAVRRERRNSLKTLVLAECVEDQGRFIGKIGEYIDSYLPMRSWTDPAHDKPLKIFNGEVVGVDLFAAENGMVVSAAYSLLGDRLDGKMREGIRREIKRRITDPYLAAGLTATPEKAYSFWWMLRDNNWNAVCNAGVLYSTLVMAESKQVRAEAVACALNSLPFYLDGFSDDGYCPEGMGYWEFGFGNYMLLGEVFKSHSAGKIDLFNDSKVRKIARFAGDFELAGNHYPSYSDAKIADVPSLYSRCALARNFGIPFRENGTQWGSGHLPQVLLNLVSGKGAPASGDPALKPRSWFDMAHVLVCRPETEEQSFFASIKAGNNGESHNHNDVGSYVVLLGGMYPCIDPGPEYYTARTFSKDRYVSDMINSWGHPVPIVGGQLQKTGREREGKVLDHSFTPEKDTIRIGLAPAYDVPTLGKLERVFEFNRKDNTVAVSDSVEFSQPETFGTAVITYEKFEIVSPQEIHIHNGETRVKVTVSAAGGKVKVSSKSIDEDAVEGKTPYRIGIDFIDPVTNATIEVKYKRIP